MNLQLPESVIPGPPGSRPSITQRVISSGRRAQAGIARQHDAYPFEFILSHPAVPGVWKNDSHIVNFGSSNYLGLSVHPKVVEAAENAIRRYGCSTAGTRLYNGTLELHRRLEEELADFYGKEAATLFQSGFTANVAMLSSLLTPRDVAIFDRESHISQREGAGAGRVRSWTFRHNDAASLRRRIETVPAHAGFAVSVDGLFSMDGSIAPLPEIAAAVKGSGGTLLVDEAHALGVLGAGGRGACEHHGCLDQADVISVSLSKALGSSGGALLGDRAVIEEITLSARSYIFTASNAPAVMGAALAALRLLRATPELLTAVRTSARRLREVITAAGWQASPGHTPIVSIPMGNRVAAIFAWRLLLATGIYGNVAIPPAVSERGSLMRLTATSLHTEDDFERLYQGLSTVRDKMRLARKPAVINSAIAVGSPEQQQ